MGNEKITGNMSMIDMLMVMAEGNPGAFTVLTQMMKSPSGLFDILLLDSLDIRGAKIWMLYNDCSNRNMGKYNRTLMALRCSAYTPEEIHENLELSYSIPFLDDSVKVEGVPSYEEEFGPTSPKWNEYIKANTEVVIPKIYEKAEKEKEFKKSL